MEVTGVDEVSWWSVVYSATAGQSFMWIGQTTLTTSLDNELETFEAKTLFTSTVRVQYPTPVLVGKTKKKNWLKTLSILGTCKIRRF